MEGTDRCWTNCSTGFFELDEGQCVGHRGVIADFRFVCEGDD
jgi:hypothetical protein